MKTLNSTATKIFSRLLSILGDNKEHQFPAPGEGFMPLVLVEQGEAVKTPFGNAKTYRLFHHYTAHGRQLADPAMCFLVADQRQQKTDFQFLYVVPCYFLQDSTGTEEESIRIEDSRITNVIPLWHFDHARFANQWLVNIRRQGYLK